MRFKLSFSLKISILFEFCCSQNDRADVSTYPHYDYLADIQDSLMEFDEATAIDILILLGEELVETSCHGIIEKAFRCLGGSLPELIASLDGVYDVLKLQGDIHTI